ncbi:MAG: hypothetical protein O8C58_02730 [Candidatus Methanoperedens sp.]|nr:hypothetical protein [Candidatus Methanoperedens sp.]
MFKKTGAYVEFESLKKECRSGAWPSPLSPNSPLRHRRNVLRSQVNSSKHRVDSMLVAEAIPIPATSIRIYGV